MMSIEPFVALQTLFDLFLVWFLCSGIVELANARTVTLLLLRRASVELA